MRLIDADELIIAVRKNVYPIRYDYQFLSCGLGMSLDGIEQAIAEMKTIILKGAKDENL